MKKGSGVGVIGVGSCLPSQVRTNDWWPSHVVEKWDKRWLARKPENPDDFEGGARLAVIANAKLAHDPFRGGMERRVLAENEQSSELETRAARAAIENAGIDKNEIGALLGFSYVPDALLRPNAIVVHKNLELPQKCMTIPVDAACNSFLAQMAVAEGLVRGGLAKYVLLVQSSTPSRILPMEEMHSTQFGDGATAVVVGAVSEGRGVIARSDRTDGSFGRTLVCTVPGKRWHDEGRLVLHVEERAQAHRMFLAAADLGKNVLDDCLAQAGATTEDVDFFACHQGTSWFRAVVQEYVGFERAKAIDTYAWASSLTGCNIPLILDVAQKERQLKDGDVVAMYSGGTGIVYSGMLLRWGR